MNDDAFQTMAMQIAAVASVGLDSHWSCSNPSFMSTSFTTPVWYSKNQRKIRPANTSGSAQGSSNPSRTGHLTLNGLFASSARPRPSTSEPGTVTTM